MEKLFKYLPKTKNFDFEKIIDVFEQKDVYNIIEGANLLLESYPELEEELVKDKVFQVSVAVLSPDDGIDIFDFLTLNQSFENFTEMTKREIVSLNKTAYEINARYIINNGYCSKAYILRVKDIGEFQTLLYTHQTELESFPVYFGNEPTLKKIVSKKLHDDLLLCQLDPYYDKGYINCYPTFSNYSNEHFSASSNTIGNKNQEDQLHGFPDAKTLAKESIQGLLQKTLKNIKVATQLGKTSIKTVDPLEIEFIFFNVENLELMGYEVAYDYDNHLDFDDDQLWVEDMHAAYLTWDHHMR